MNGMPAWSYTSGSGEFVEYLVEAVPAPPLNERIYAEMLAFAWADRATRRRDSRSVVRCLTQSLHWLAIAETYPS